MRSMREPIFFNNFKYYFAAIIFFPICARACVNEIGSR